MKFELDLARILAVIGPYVKAIQCLEGGHITADQVYYYWLGITSQLDALFQRNGYDLKTRTIEDIHAITNSCFDEMITDAPNNVYITAFFLNPGTWQWTTSSMYLNLMAQGIFNTEYHNAPIYKKPNPLAIPPLVIRHKDGVATSSLKMLTPEDVLRHVGVISMPDPPIQSTLVPDPTPIHTEYLHWTSPRTYTTLCIGHPSSLPPSYALSPFS